MKNTITKRELNDHLCHARVALVLQSRELYKRRNGFCGKSFRQTLRDNIRALRVLSNLNTIEATLYSSFASPKVGKAEKILGL